MVGIVRVVVVVSLNDYICVQKIHGIHYSNQLIIKKSCDGLADIVKVGL